VLDRKHLYMLSDTSAGMLHVSNIEQYLPFPTTLEGNLCNATNKSISSSSKVSVIFVSLLT